MLRLKLAAVMIIGLSTISPPAEGPSTENGSYTPAPSYHPSGTAALEEASVREPGFTMDIHLPLVGLLPVQQRQSVGAASSGYESPGTDAIRPSADDSGGPSAAPEESLAAAPEESQSSAPEDAAAAAPEEAPATAEPVRDDEASTLNYQMINGLDLSADREAVTRLFGEPLAIVPDDWTPGMEEYQYRDIRVGLYEDYIDYLIVPVSAGQVRIGDVTAALDMEQLQELLGEPEFTAEDGLVYIQDGVCIKLFFEDNGTDLSTLQVYWAAHV
ncbi:hypothetical protein [Paenibacillus sp. 1P07SE]|uniref:hypothetical protein n=1 Tax=Paenibacillus sp. 1P07SE TaxID=3132209 RepID=UPI0039A72500